MYDIAIVGMGPAGLSFAKALDGTGLKIAIIEKSSSSDIENPSYDGREIALTHRAKKIMTDLGQWKFLSKKEISLINHAKVVNGTSAYSLDFSALTSGQKNLGFMVSNHHIRKAAYQAVSELSGLDMINTTEVTGMMTGKEKTRLSLSSGNYIEARMVVAADSRFSSIRRMAGIATDMFDFGRTCIVCKMSIQGDHDNTAYECFQYDRTLAILPLNHHEVSVVITADADQAHKILQTSEDDFNSDITERARGRYGAMMLSTKKYAYPLVATYARSFYTHHFALIGDAAVGMHPVTAHGFNLGLYGVEKLSEQIKAAVESGVDFSSNRVLAAYSHQHRRETRPIYIGTNALVQLYTKDSPLARIARNALLHIGNSIPPAKRLITNKLTDSRSGSKYILAA